LIQLAAEEGRIPMIGRLAAMKVVESRKRPADC
jgi:hypothetical protein